jgi:hypothetical protein
MPNIEPQGLPIRPQGWPGDCSAGNCVDIEPNGDKFDFVSTLGADKGRTTYEASEVAAFLADVKAGKWDAVQARAEALAAKDAVSV